jgi:hypothetical protein
LTRDVGVENGFGAERFNEFDLRRNAVCAIADFTAVLAAGDSLAVGAMMGVQQQGYSVPGDVSIMGMDDLPQAAFLNPPLTTMHISMREIGSVALDLLRDSLSGLPMPPAGSNSRVISLSAPPQGRTGHFDRLDRRRSRPPNNVQTPDALARYESTEVIQCRKMTKAAVPFVNGR